MAADAAIPPQNLEAEASLLGGMMVAERVIAPVVADVRLQPEHFYSSRHRSIYEAILALSDRSEPVDSLTVSEELRRQGKLDAVGGREFIQTLASTTPSAANAPHYANIVKEAAHVRELLNTILEIQREITAGGGEPAEILERAEALVFRAVHHERSGDFRHLEEILREEVDKLHASHGGVTGVETGFRDLDGITGGLQPGNLIVLAARPSMGKSALVANIAENAAVEHKRKVALFSLEMSEAELAHRLIACRGRIRGQSLRHGNVSEQEWPRVWEACEVLHRAPLWIDDSSDMSLMEIRAKSRRLTSQHGLDLIIVDYLQLLRPDRFADSRVEQVGQMSRGLKILARELNVPVIAVAQLNRSPEQRPDKRPLLSDLRESGSIEQDADVVLFIYRDEYYNPETTERPGEAEVLIAKHRNGPVGKVDLAFMHQYPKFHDLARQEPPPGVDLGMEPAGSL